VLFNYYIYPFVFIKKKKFNVLLGLCFINKTTIFGSFFNILFFHKALWFFGICYLLNKNIILYKSYDVKHEIKNKN